MMGVPELDGGWRASVYLVALLIAWTGMIAGLLALIRRFDQGHDPAPASRSDGPEQRKVA